MEDLKAKGGSRRPHVSRRITHGSPALPVPSLSTAHQSFFSWRHFPLLDGLRCLSTVAVAWHHAGGSTYLIGILTRG
jgi:hypothetical protein